MCRAKTAQIKKLSAYETLISGKFIKDNSIAHALVLHTRRKLFFQQNFDEAMAHLAKKAKTEKSFTKLIR